MPAQSLRQTLRVAIQLFRRTAGPARATGVLVVCVAEPAIYGGEDGLVGPVCGVLRSLVNLAVAHECHAEYCGIAAGGGGLQAQDPVAGYLKQMSGKDGQALETPNALPAKYASHETSGIAFTVQGPDANDFKVELTD